MIYYAKQKYLLQYITKDTSYSVNGGVYETQTRDLFAASEAL